MKNEVITAYPSPVKVLSISAAPLRELLNFLIYRNNPDLLNERGRKQPALSLTQIPSSIKELGSLLGAERCEKGRKLYFDCARTEKQQAVLIHNLNAQLWVHYFSCGIGLVDISHFIYSSPDVSKMLPIGKWEVCGSYEYQWFTHDLDGKFFGEASRQANYKKLARYFINEVNPNLVCPYTIYRQEKVINDGCKFVQGSLDDLKRVIKNALIVCESLKRERFPEGKSWVSPHLTITCGNLREKPSLIHSTEPFVTQIGHLAVEENIPYTVLNANDFQRTESSSLAQIRKDKHRIYLNLEEEIREMTPREKIAAKVNLVDWLKKQGRGGQQIIKIWKLES